MSAYVSLTEYYGRATEGSEQGTWTFGNPLETYSVYLPYIRMFIPPGTIATGFDILTNDISSATSRHQIPPDNGYSNDTGYFPATLTEVTDSNCTVHKTDEGVLYPLASSEFGGIGIEQAGWYYVNMGPEGRLTQQFSAKVDAVKYNAWFDTYIKDEAGWNTYVENVETYALPSGEGEKLFLEFTESDGSQHFVDSSAEANVISFYGNARIATAQYMFGGSSCRLDGVGDTYLSTSGNSTAFDFGTDAFTLEMWIRPDSIASGAKGLLVKDGSWGIYQNGTGLTFEYGGQTVNFGDGALIAYQWSHIAVCRNGAYLFCSANGTVEELPGTSEAYVEDYATRVTIGRGADAGSHFAGYMDDIKVYKGSAKYTEDFNPYPDASAYITVTPTILSFGSVSIKNT